MNLPEDQQLINFHNLAIELRRLKKNNNPIPTFALLINQNINPKFNFSNFKDHPQSQILINLCNTALNRFCFNPSADSYLLITMMKFSNAQTIIGQLLLFDLLLSNYSVLFDSKVLIRLNNYDRDFMMKYFLSKIYSNPQNLNKNSIESFLPLQIPSLNQLIQNSETDSSSFLHYLVKILIEKSFEDLSDCLSNEQLFQSLSNLVFQFPSFFEIVKIFNTDNKKLAKIFQKLKEINPSKFLNSFLAYYSQNTIVSDIFSQIFPPNEFIQFVTQENIDQIFFYLRSTNNWITIETLYNKYPNIKLLLSNLLFALYNENQSNYLKLFSQLKFDFFMNDYVIDSISKGQINPDNFIYILNQNNLAVQLATSNSYLLHHLIQAPETINEAIQFLKRNPILIPQNILDHNSIVLEIYEINDVYIFDLFNDPQVREGVIYEIIRMIALPNTLVKFPSNNFFKQLAQFPNCKQILSNLYEFNQNLLTYPNWSEMLKSVSPLLFATIELNIFNQECFDIFIQYISSNQETFSTNIKEFGNLINFFKTTTNELFSYSNLSLSTQLILLDCFAKSCHTLFSNLRHYSEYKTTGGLDTCQIDIADNSSFIGLFIDFFEMMSSTQVFSLKSHSNEIIKKDFLSRLLDFGYDPAKIGQMILEFDLKNSTDVDLDILDMDQIPIIDNVSVQLNPLLTPESLQLIATYIQNSLADPDAILGMEPGFLKEFAEMIFSALSSTRSPIWMNFEAVDILCSILMRLQEVNAEINLTPAFLQALAFMTCEENPQIATIDPQLIEVYKRLTGIVALSPSFEGALLELL